MTGIDHGKAAWNYVSSLSNALSAGDHSLGTVPGLLKRVLAEQLWREFTPPGGVMVSHARFVDFVEAQPTDGLGATVDLVERLVAGDNDAAVLLREALKGNAGRPKQEKTRSNPTGLTVDRGRSYTLERLTRERPDLRAQVDGGELSAHAAAVTAGFRKPTATIRLDSAESIARTLRKQLTSDVLHALIVELQGGE